ANNSAGNICIAAFSAGNTGALGQVLISGTTPGFTITAGATAGGFTTNGIVTIVAGATANNAINVPNIDISGGTGGGSITLASSTPDATAASPVSVGTGALAGGPVLLGSMLVGGTVQPANIVSGDLTAPFSFIKVTSGQNVQLGNLDVTSS